MCIRDRYQRRVRGLLSISMANTTAGQKDDMLSFFSEKKTLNAVLGMKYYIYRMLREGGAGGKALLLDEHTRNMMSMVFSQNELLEAEIYDIAQLPPPPGVTYDNKHPHLRCIVFVRPTRESINLLQGELEQPRYGSYELHFSNIVEPGVKANKKSMLMDLARADKHCLIQSVHEFFGDYYACQDILFTLQQDEDVAHYHRDSKMANTDRTVQGLSSFLLSHKRTACLRYQESSAPCRRLAEQLGELISNKESDVHSFSNRAGTPLLLMFDRNEDPLTPLLKPWTYQAMLHEYIGIRQNTVDLRGLPGAKSGMRDGVDHPEEHMFVLCPGWGPPTDEGPNDPSQDDFYAGHMYADYATVGEHLAQEIEEYQKKTSPGQINKSEVSIEDLQNLAAKMPEIRRASGIISKHLDFLQQFKKQIDSRHIWDGSVIEQEMSAEPDLSAGDARDRIVDYVQAHRVHSNDLLKLILIWCLKYNKIDETLMGLLEQQADDKEVARMMALPERLLNYAGRDKRDAVWNNLFVKRSTRDKMKSMFKRLKDAPEDVSDFLRHKPLLIDLLDKVFAGTLDEESFPVKCGNHVVHPKEVIVFVVGGCTYAEAAAVDAYNKKLEAEGVQSRVVLGGTCMHDSKSFLKMVTAL
eukprot:TRINITY_DN2823_c0_g1_i1.p1 TRINITY_DN2823_c0_g1~~TRINITY_DN2823_c0_g1_i1.p1  ORF type:complete len:638 (+),score=230.44 TRINITY_DN2823_c0_g1_i1:131-2044(+)